MKNLKKIDDFIEDYLKKRLNIWVNEKEVSFNYLGKEYIDDITYCYLEIPKVSKIKSITMSNQILHEVFEDQQNIARFNILNKKKSFLLVKGDPECMLNFD